MLGGKWTVYRAMAEHAIDAVQKNLTGRITDCRTRHHPLVGVEDQTESIEELLVEYRVDMSTVRHLKEKFGSHRSRVLDLARENASFLLPIVAGSPYIQAEVVYCAREEMAVCIEDILSRRLGLQFYDWRLAIHAAPIVGQILARELGWSTAHTQEQIDRYVDGINRSLETLGLQPVRALGMQRKVN